MVNSRVKTMPKSRWSASYVGAARTRGLDEIAEVPAQFRRAAGDVHDVRAMLLNPRADAVRGLRVHHLRAPRRGIDMTVAAGLVALAAHVDL